MDSLIFQEYFVYSAFDYPLHKFSPILLFVLCILYKHYEIYAIDYIRSYSAVLQQSFRFAVFPKQYITFNPMQYVVMRHKKDDMDLFAEETDTDNGNVKPLSFEQYQKLIASTLRNNA